MKPYYDHNGITIYHGDCREVLPTLDKVLKNGLTNSTTSETIEHDEKQTRPRQGGEGESPLGTAQSGDSVVISGAEMVGGTDGGLLRCVTDRNEQDPEAVRDSVKGAGAQGEGERQIQGRETEQAVSPDDRERQVRDLFGDGEACGSPQERGSLRQQAGESSNTVRELPQQASQEVVVEFALVTDPPYGLGIAAKPVRQKHGKSAWDNKPVDSSLLAMCMDVCSAQIIWGGNYFGLPANQCFLVWDKRQPQDFSLAMCEQAWTNLKMPAKLFRRSVLSYKKQHPTEKPVDLMVWCMQFLPAAQTILDPFMGSGTTLVAAKQLGRKCIGIELEEKSCEIAVKRLQQEYLALQQ